MTYDEETIRTKAQRQVFEPRFDIDFVVAMPCVRWCDVRTNDYIIQNSCVLTNAVFHKIECPAFVYTRLFRRIFVACTVSVYNNNHGLRLLQTRTLQSVWDIKMHTSKLTLQSAHNDHCRQTQYKQRKCDNSNAYTWMLDIRFCVMQHLYAQILPTSNLCLFVLFRILSKHMICSPIHSNWSTLDSICYHLNVPSTASIWIS